jgi:signal transduction histidine kinase/HAMP domain-containing protein
MSFFSNLNIKHKILSVVMVIVFLELALFAGGIYFLNTLNNHLVQLVDIDARKMKLAAEVKSDMLEIHRAQKNIILHPSKEEVGRQMIQKSRYISDFRIHLAELERLTNPQERLSIVELSNGMQAFLTIDKQIEALVQPDAMDGFTQGAFAAATALSIGSARVAYNQSSQLIDTIIEEMEKALDTHRIESGHYFNLALLLMLMLCFAGLIIGWVAGLMVARNIAANLEGIIQVTDAIAQGRLDTPVVVKNNDETGRLAASVLKMQAQLIDVKNAAADRDWVKTGVARINDAMRGVVNIPELCRNVITEMATYMEAGVGAIFLSNHSGAEPVLELGGGYAYTTAHPFLDHFHAGEGLVGQAMLAKAPITVQNVPSDYFKVCSGLGDGCPACSHRRAAAVRRSGHRCGRTGFFQTAYRSAARVPSADPSRSRHQYRNRKGQRGWSKALARAQVLAEELQQQQDELKATNEELEEQTQRLKDSEQKLKQQQNELEEANAELEEKNEYLQNQKEVIERANRELDRTRLDIEEKAEQLAMASKYKSEFLANMSHELRTPLNSILLLARMLSDNSDGNLTLEQVQSAEIIASSGNDLLTLINEVLDLAKIEAGRMELNIERIDVQELKESITYHYAHLARDKGLSIDVSTRPECPAELHTDRKRLDQILRNLVSNAVKFTEKGGIRIEIGRAAGDEINGARTVAITVTDTGIGIPADKQKVVFEAFQQLDTGTARKFPGTGLGLSICKNLANLLGGDILLQASPASVRPLPLFCRMNGGRAPQIQPPLSG